MNVGNYRDVQFVLFQNANECFLFVVSQADMNANGMPVGAS